MGRIYVKLFMQNNFARHFTNFVIFFFVWVIRERLMKQWALRYKNRTFVNLKISARLSVCERKVHSDGRLSGWAEKSLGILKKVRSLKFLLINGLNFSWNNSKSYEAFIRPSSSCLEARQGEARNCYCKFIFICIFSVFLDLRNQEV